MICDVKKFWWLLFVLPLLLACQEDPERGESSGLSNGLLTESGEYLGLKQCSDNLDAAAHCYQDGPVSESTSQKFTFVLCTNGVSSSPSECSPVFWSEGNAPLRVEISPSSVGYQSELARDLADMRNQLANQENLDRTITGGLAIGSGVAYGVHRLAYVRGLAGHSVSLKFVAVAMALLAAGQYVVSAVVMPTLNRGFFGKQTGTVYSIDQAINQGGQGGQLLPYYQPTKEEQSFIRKSEGIFQLSTLKPVPLKDREAMDSFVDLLGESLVHHKAATAESLHKICLPDEKSSSVLTCKSVGDNEQSTLDAKIALEAVAAEQKHQLASKSSGGVEVEEQAQQSGEMGGNDEIATADASDQTSASELSGGAQQQSRDPLLDQVFAGTSDLDLIDSSTHETCKHARCLSSFEGEEQIYVVEGYFNCLIYGGGEACGKKYGCGYVPKDSASCLKLAETLSAIKGYLNYELGQFNELAKNHCAGFGG